MGFTILHRCLILEIVGCVIMMCLSSFQKKLCAFQWQGYDYDWQPISMLLHYQLSLCFGVTFVQHLSLTVLCCYFRAPFVPNLFYSPFFLFYQSVLSYSTPTLSLSTVSLYIQLIDFLLLRTWGKLCFAVFCSRTSFTSPNINDKLFVCGVQNIDGFKNKNIDVNSPVANRLLFLTVQ